MSACLGRNVGYSDRLSEVSKRCDYFKPTSYPSPAMNCHNILQQTRQPYPVMYGEQDVSWGVYEAISMKKWCSDSCNNRPTKFFSVSHLPMRTREYRVWERRMGFSCFSKFICFKACLFFYMWRNQHSVVDRHVKRYFSSRKSMLYWTDIDCKH